MKIALFSLLVMVSTLMHPFHVGITEMSYDAKSHTLQISQRLFSDDLENGISSASGQAFDILEASQAERDSLVLDYLRHRFYVRQKGKRLPLRYLGSEFEEEALWIYFDIPVDDTRHLTLHNTLLFNEFDDQQNLVHITTDDGEIRSYVFDEDEKEQAIYQWQ